MLTPRRSLAGLATAAVLLLVATLILTSLRDHATLATDLAIYLLIVVIASVVGGVWAGLPAALVSSVLLNFYFTDPVHTLRIDDEDDLVALIVFLVVAAVVSRVVDVSAQRRHQAVQAAAEATNASTLAEVRTALLNAVSHDLRTPLASAKAAVSGLLDADVRWSDADKAELLQSADGSLDRLTDLITNLLDLSRLQAGVLPVFVEPVSLDGVVQRALDHAAPSDAPIEIEVPDDLPEVLVDAGLLERVVANLVQNALRYSPDGAPVRVTATAYPGWIDLSIVDAGPGIPRAEAESVFAAFQRRDDAHPGEGVGLGLAIARGFAEAMGGTVSAERTPGGGATMVVRLKAAPS